MSQSTIIVAYLVWDLHPGYAYSGNVPKWYPTAYVPDIISAKRWAGPDSMITEHNAEDAFRIYRSKQLPQTYKVIS